MSKRIGSNFDDFLDQGGVLAEAEAIAVKRVIAFQLEELVKEQKLTKTQLARRMKTSRASLDRLLDPDNASVTLLTLTQGGTRCQGLGQAHQGRVGCIGCSTPVAVLYFYRA